MIDRYRGGAGEYAWDLLIHLDASHVWSAWNWRTVMVLSTLFLFGVRNAEWTQLFVCIYMADWVLVHCISIRHANGDPNRAQSINRRIGVIFALLCHFVLLTTTSEPPETQSAMLTDGLVAGVVAISATFFSSDHEHELDYSVMALIGQSLFAMFTGFVWMLAYGPVAVIRESSRSMEWEYLRQRLTPAINIHMGMMCFLCSRRDLERARLELKAVVGALWVAMGAFYYCYFYDVYSAFWRTSCGTEGVA